MGPPSCLPLLISIETNGFGTAWENFTPWIVGNLLISSLAPLRAGLYRSDLFPCYPLIAFPHWILSPRCVSIKSHHCHFAVLTNKALQVCFPKAGAPSSLIHHSSFLMQLKTYSQAKPINWIIWFFMWIKREENQDIFLSSQKGVFGFLFPKSLFASFIFFSIPAKKV